MTGFEIGVLALGGTAVGMTAYSSYQQGKSQAAWNEYNARVAEREAASEREANAFEAKQHRREARMMQAKQRAMVGASGIEASGSPLLVMEDTAAQLAIENAQIMSQGARRVSQFKSQAILDRMAGKAAKQAGTLNAGASILGGASDAMYKYKTLQS